MRRRDTMFRWATAVAMSLFIFPSAAALADVPIPKPNPLLSERANPQAALARFVEDDAPISANVAAYAPASGGTATAPRSTTAATLYVVGKLDEDSGPIGDGLIWRVYSDYPDAAGQLPLVHKGRGGDLELRVTQGRYIVHVAYGRAAMSRVVEVSGTTTSDTFVLNAGGLQLNAVLDDVDSPRSAEANFELYMLENGTRRLIGNMRPGAIARLPAGSYHVISKYGAVNAIRSADVVVEAGKLTRVSLRHKAGKVRLKLVRSAGGEAIANTEWTVYADDGRAIYERVGAHANITLAAGDYAVVARHGDGEFTRRFTVQSGEDAEVVVRAQRRSAPL